MSSLKLKHVSKKYPNGREAVADFNLEVPEGQFAVLQGPSGCGKSVVLRLIAGMEEVTEGSIILDGQVISDLDQKDRGVAMIHHNLSLYPHMSLYDNLAFGLKLRKVPEEQIDRIVRKTAGILDLSHLLDRKPRALSRGQRQRAAIGMAAVRNPKIYLMDEPMANMDEKLRIQLQADLKKLCGRTGRTVLYATRDPEEAKSLGTQVAVMEDGRILSCENQENNIC